jgi:hypothetical protein
MNAIDLNEIVSSRITSEGVETVTMGTVACANFRDQARALLKSADSAGYAEYRSTKYPAGEGSATPETRLAATSFLFDRVRDLLVPHYVRTK